MSATKTQAFVLKTRPYRDTSLLAYFYTKDYGKINGIVKGIRDTRARFGGMLEPFSLNEILFYRKRRGGDLHLVTQSESLEHFPEVREDLERLGYASYFVDLVNELVELEDPSPRVFDLLNDSLKFLSSGASPKRTARIFEVKLFELLGLMPETALCVICRALGPEPAYFSIALGGIHCARCRNSQGSTSSIPLSKGTLNFLEHVKRSEVKDLAHVKVSQEVGAELQKILRRFVDFHLQNKLKSVIFLEKMGLT